MHKIMRLVHDDDRILVEQINNAYQKLENNGCKIVSTQIVKEPYIKYIAYIVYEKQS